MRSLPALIGLTAACCVAAGLLALKPKTAESWPPVKIEADQIEEILGRIVSYNVHVDADGKFAELIGGTVFTTKTRIYPLHRNRDGDYYESRGLDDFGAGVLDYNVYLECEPDGDGYKYSIEVLGRAQRVMSDKVLAEMKAALNRRMALNFANMLIYIQHYEDFKLAMPEGKGG